MQIILASQSKYRKKVLEDLGLEFKIIPPNVDEKSIVDDNPLERVKKLAEAKIKAVAQPDSIIIGGDLFVFFNGKAFGKPGSKEKAIEMLKEYSGNTVEVISSIAVFNSKTNKMLIGTEICVIKFKNISEDEIKDYVYSFAVEEMAGGFEIQGVHRFAEHFDNPFLNAVPVKKLIALLKENGINVQ